MACVLAVLFAYCGHPSSSAGFSKSIASDAPRVASIPDPAAVPSHVLDVIHLQGYNGSTRDIESVARYVSFIADPDTRHVAAIHAAGMKTYVYSDFMLVYPCRGCSPMYSDVADNPTVWATDCSGNPVRVPSNGAQVVDPTLPLTYRLYKRHFVESGRVDGNDYVFFDDIPGQPYGASGTPCNQASFGAAIAKNVSSLGIPGAIYNGFQSGQSLNPPDVLRIVTATTIPAGAMEENCYSFHDNWGVQGDGVLGAAQWRNVENDEIAMARRHLVFMCYAKAIGRPSDSTAIRLFVYASFGLTYDPATTYIEEALYANDIDRHNPVLPEYQLVALSPTTGEPTSISDLMLDGVYVRQYSRCYMDRISVGGCAFVVNPDSSVHAYPLGSEYRHSLTLSGGSIFDGGTAAFRGGIPSEVDAHTGLIVSTGR